VSRLGLLEGGSRRGRFPGPVPLNPGVRGEYTKGAVRWYPPSTTGRQFVGEQRRGKMDTQWSSESRLEHSVEASGRIVLECSGCGEELLLLGLEEGWPKEHRDAFECTCGKTVTLADRVDGTAYAIKTLLKGSIKARPGARRS
jgi:hypothetical protein